MNKKIKFTSNPNIRRKNYADANEYIFDKRTNIVPKKKNRLLCIIFAENRGCSFIYHNVASNPDVDVDFFRYRKGMYIIDNEAIHIAGNGCRVAFYLEGVSTPIKMSNIEKFEEKIEYIDLYGKKKTSIVTKIKGLKFDAKILDTFANRRFSELFTTVKADKLTTLVFVFSIITMALAAGGVIASYVFQGA